MKQVPTVESEYGVFVLPERIGLSEIPMQLAHGSKNEGFVLNVLAIGRRHLGISTLINALFAAPLVDKNRSDDCTTSVSEIEEDGISLRVSITTYHGDDLALIENLIRTKYKEYFEREQGLSRKVEDRRIHACLFVVPPDPLRPSEIQGIVAISKLCNLIPIITKADAFMEEELEAHRAEVHKLFAESGINVFCFREDKGSGAACSPLLDRSSGMAVATTENTGNDETQARNENEECFRWPLCTIASEKSYDVHGQIIRGRKYPWGFIDISNEAYSDFRKLQRILVSEGYDELVWSTDTKFYNEYRKTLRAKEQPAFLRKRYTQLIEEMEKILNGKHELLKEELLREEKMIDVYFPNETEGKEPVALDSAMESAAESETTERAEAVRVSDELAQLALGETASQEVSSISKEPVH